jgi:pimeloyl-ACP methyl ester carboxylesterase
MIIRACGSGRGRRDSCRAGSSGSRVCFEHVRELAPLLDGVWSAVRHRLFPQTQPQFSGLIAWRGSVLDAANSRRAAILSFFDGGFMSMLFAATYPDRVSHLILWDCSPTWMSTPDTPWGATAEETAEWLAGIERQWGTRELAHDWTEFNVPSLAGDVTQDAFLRAWQRLEELKEPGRFGAWLGRIVRNLALDARRRGSRRVARRVQASRRRRWDRAHTYTFASARRGDSPQPRARLDRISRQAGTPFSRHRAERSMTSLHRGARGDSHAAG